MGGGQVAVGSKSPLLEATVPDPMRRQRGLSQRPWLPLGWNLRQLFRVMR